jgi:hypothetical protein
MNERFKNLAKRTGFMFWQNEEWKPESAVIDWAANYDKEFEEYSKELVAECARIARKYVLDKSGSGNRFGGTVFVEETIRAAFGLDHENLDNTGTSVNEYQDILSTEDCILGAPHASGQGLLQPYSNTTVTVIPPWEC